MRSTRRFVRDESGMTLAMAMIMVVLIGAMGAGLLTFVMTDLNTVSEQNRGQTAFEVADAGIEAAKHELASNVDIADYDGVSPDIQWSGSAGGVTLTNLGDGPTEDEVNVKIWYRDDTKDFRVVSEGTYGVAKRRIEAIFEAAPVGIGCPECENIGQPTYYTPSSILIDGPNVGVKGISLFSRMDILIEDARPPVPPPPTYSYSNFKDDYTDRNNASVPRPGTLNNIQGTNDALCNWDSAPPVLSGCFQVQGRPAGQGNYNTLGRIDLDVNGNNNSYLKPGFAAEGKICSVPQGTNIGTCGDLLPSIANARNGYTYDSTTTPRFEAKEDLIPPLNPNVDENPIDNSVITYPFPRLTPNPEYFRCVARRDPPPPICDATNSAGYWVGDPANPLSGDPADSDWGLDTSNDSLGRIVFVDAQGQRLKFDPDGNGQVRAQGERTYKGIIVVWCGELEQDHSFRGIILNLYGNGLDGSTDCANEDGTPRQLVSGVDVGVYTNNGQDCECWVYARGGTPTRAGIILRPDSNAMFLPGGRWDDSLTSDAFVDPDPTQFVLKSWRELYS